MIQLIYGGFMKEIRWLQRFENFEKSLQNLDETIDCINKNGINKIYTMALIQAFEISFELGWKTIKDYLEYNGIKTDTPRETIKEAFSMNLITDGQTWINMMESRNKTSHTYKEFVAKEIAEEILNQYALLLNQLKLTLEGKKNV